MAVGFIRSVAGLVISVTVATLLSRATGLERYATIIMGIQWVGALGYAVPMKDEKYLDITGSLTFASVSLLAYYESGETSWRGALLTAFVWFWCIRLGTFLYLRIQAAGEDTRFEEIRENRLRFFSLWNIQGLWIFLTLQPVLLSLKHSTNDAQVDVLDIVGTSLWIIGYLLEVVADYQKTQFHANKRNHGKFIQSGLWSYSRHPNYFGEMLMWLGVFLVAVHGLPTLGFRIAASVCPAFVTFLLTKVSGIPLLEKQGQERWGKLPAYRDYVARTSMLVPLPSRPAATETVAAPAS